VPAPGSKEPALDVSVVVPVVDRLVAAEELFGGLAAALHARGETVEFIFVVDQRRERLVAELRRLRELLEAPVVLILLARPFQEATGLAVGFEHARAELVLTIPSFFQVEIPGLVALVEAVASGVAELAIARRTPRRGGWANRTMSALFHRIVRRVTGTPFRDLTNSCRAMTREVARSLVLYGELHRFIPVMAVDLGFEVCEVPVAQHQHDRPRRLYGPAVYLRRLLDLLTVFFLVRFTRRPLRFFGFLGAVTAGLGAAVSAYLGVARLLGQGPIAERPLLLFGVLLIVLGIQSVSLGLLGEIIIFTHARQIRGYRVVRVIGGAPVEREEEPAAAVVGGAVRGGRSGAP
jgi:hypothetical protein